MGRLLRHKTNTFMGLPWLSTAVSLLSEGIFNGMVGLRDGGAGSSYGVQVGVRQRQLPERGDVMRVNIGVAILLSSTFFSVAAFAQSANPAASPGVAKPAVAQATTPAQVAQAPAGGAATGAQAGPAAAATAGGVGVGTAIAVAAGVVAVGAAASGGSSSTTTHH